MTPKPAAHTPYISLADAARIMGYDKALAAVNAHEELLDALKLLIEDYGTNQVAFAKELIESLEVKQS